MKSDFMVAIQSRAARVAVGPSAVRGQVRGTTAAARRFLARLNLRPFGTSDDLVFRRALNRATLRLQAALPKESSSWGLSRKLLNIFLRDCLYTVYLRNEFNLHRAETFLELPLDSIVAKQLRAEYPTLPPWSRVKLLTKEVSEQYQAAADKLAAKKRIERVHLDATFWSWNRDI